MPLRRAILMALAPFAALPVNAEARQRCPVAIVEGEVTHVRDGDTIEVDGLPIRLNGLAAPEGDEPGGSEATEAMRRMVLGHEIRCELDGERTRDRCVGICRLTGEDISEVMVRRGLARDCPRFSGGALCRGGTAGGGRGCDDRAQVPPARVLPAAMIKDRDTPP